MIEVALFLVAMGFLALIGIEAERTLNSSAGFRERLMRDNREPARVRVNARHHRRWKSPRAG